MLVYSTFGTTYIAEPHSSGCMLDKCMSRFCLFLFFLVWLKRVKSRISGANVYFCESRSRAKSTAGSNGTANFLAEPFQCYYSLDIRENEESWWRAGGGGGIGI